MKTNPFWRDDFPRPTDLPVSPLPDDAGVAIVGGGITGLVAARSLAQAGGRPVVLEAATLGAGASTVNGGMTTYGLKVAASTALRRYGVELGTALWQASQDAVDSVEKLVRDEGIECNYQRDGAAELGYGDRDYRGFLEESRWMADRLDFRTEVLGPDRVAEVVGGGRFRCAQVDSFSAGLHPARYTYGVARAAHRAGATLVEHAEVLGITPDGDGHILRTAIGSVRARQVLLATNGHTGGLVPALQRRVIPVGSYIVVTEPLPEEIGRELIPDGRMLWTSRRFLNYFRLTPDGRLLMGGRQDLSTDLDLADSAQRLRRTVVDFFPTLHDVEITHSWSGRIGVTFDLMPHIGRTDGIWYSLGYSGHGVAVATYSGSEVAALISGAKSATPFATIDHPSRWYYRKRPWFLPAAARMYRLLDRVGR